MFLVTLLGALVAAQADEGIWRLAPDHFAVITPAGDVIVAVGTTEGLAAMRELVRR